MAGVEYTPAYKNGWSGITYLLDKTGKFNSGLYTKVAEFLKENNIDFITEDLRTIQVKNKPIDISKKLESMKMIPRDYQIDILNACINNNKGIVRACTGSGKTLCTAMITAHYNEPTIIGVIGLDLLGQFHSLYSKIFDEEIGYIGNGICNIKRINICSIWTLASALKVDKKNIVDDESNEDEIEPDQSQSDKIKQMLNNTKLFIFDESHVVTTNTIGTIYNNIDPQYIFGFSGTPFREDNSDLLVHGILGEQIVDVSASRLIKAGVLAQPIIKFVSVPYMKPESDNYQGVYKEYVVDNDVRNELIIKNLVKLLEKGYTPLVLFKQIKHGKILFKMMRDAGIKCEMLSGKDSLERRNEVKEKISTGKIQAIIASTIFDIGIDIPILNSLVLAGSGKSSIAITQRVGRALRPFPGKNRAIIIDFYDNVRFLKNHSMTRHKVYSIEDGFQIIKSKEMK